MWLGQVWLTTTKPSLQPEMSIFTLAVLEVPSPGKPSLTSSSDPFKTGQGSPLPLVLQVFHTYQFTLGSVYPPSPPLVYTLLQGVTLSFLLLNLRGSAQRLHIAGMDR